MPEVEPGKQLLPDTLAEAKRMKMLTELRKEKEKVTKQEAARQK